ncbi:AAA+ family ATPase [Yoonia sediminilitoris]|uniref:AAA+ family ATPase n=1 Tax=Yoonia sediminilitoris TaxID=1286148 RepID=A0A2T6KQ44_9RHOB|nr:AAA+ family ATPase [Yoonia sediminilitoris]PUB18678.1 hypothetical protein C8N45_101263 [Yoonia sediminilitoris]RCW98846.1 hypothetical protein DFP92_101263 [Yoonia sediminilitoris]
MKPLYVAMSLLYLSAPAAHAQDADVEEGFSLIEEGAKMLMRGLISEMEPAMSELRGQLEEIGPEITEFVQQMGPAFSEFLSRVDDFRYYEAPEILPNGDIIMRRKPAAPDWTPDETPGDIEL